MGHPCLRVMDKLPIRCWYTTSKSGLAVRRGAFLQAKTRVTPCQQLLVFGELVEALCEGNLETSNMYSSLGGSQTWTLHLTHRHILLRLEDV